MSPMNINYLKGPYYSTQDAATYLGFSYDYFRKIALKHSIPRYGPGKNRFAETDLDKFMVNPDYFQNKMYEEKPQKRNFQPIKIKEE